MIRPEWLFELVQRVQESIAPAAESGSPSPADEFLGVSPPETELESQLVHDLRLRLDANRTQWLGRQSPGASASSRAATASPPVSEGALFGPVAEAVLLVQRDFNKRWTVQALARRVRSNRTDLQIGFRRYCGRSVRSHLAGCRVDVAKHLLRTTEWCIDEVSKEVGWHSKVSLYGAFRRTLGFTPDEYRRRWRSTFPNERVAELIRRLRS